MVDIARFNLTDGAEVSLEDQMRDAMMAAGIQRLPPTIVFDGAMHRFNSGGKKHNDNGWYIAHDDGVPAGAFGCWRLGLNEQWRGITRRTYTPAEEIEGARRLAEIRALRDNERARQHAVAASVVTQIWEDLDAAPADHPYLVRKGIKPHDLRVTGGDNRLAIPMRDVDGVLMSIQYIDEAGHKRYHEGARIKGAMTMLGSVHRGPKTKAVGPVYIVEGFATGATVHEVTGALTVVAFSANALKDITGTCRDLWGEDADIIIVADNDDTGVGRNAADQAAATHGARIVIPPTPGDANDYAQAGYDLAALLTPDHDTWLMRGSDFAAQPAPIAWLVRGWLQSKALMMAHGPSGHGKTFVVLDWCLRIAAGVPDWQGQAVRHGPVVYLAGEGHHGLRGRVAAWMEHHHMPANNIWVSRSGCDLDKPEGLQKAKKAIAGLETTPTLIVVDTLHRFLSGDENSAQDAGAMIDACGALMEAFHCSVLLVHHTGNNEDAQGRARGSSAWRGALDIEISVRRPDGETIIIEQKKSKDAEMLPPRHAQLVKVTIPGWVDDEGQPVTSAVVEAASAPAPKTKGLGPAEKHRKTFEEAWRASGCERWQGGPPYVSRGAMIHFLEERGDPPSSAEQAVKPSGGRLINQLLDAHFIESVRPSGPESKVVGWVIVDPLASSALLLGLQK